jgi:uncharacterized protein YecE (DUF72 family)
MDRGSSLIHLGTHGWELAGDPSGFYPPDLPPEWRLELYTTQFHAVEVPALTAPPEPGEAAAWHEQTLPDARFAVLIGPQALQAPGGYQETLRRLHAGLEPLGAKLAVLLWPQKPPLVAPSLWPGVFHLQEGVDTAASPEAVPSAHPRYWRIPGSAAEPQRLGALAERLAEEQARGRRSFVFFHGETAASRATALADLLAARGLA